MILGLEGFLEVIYFNILFNNFEGRLFSYIREWFWS